MRKVVQTPRQVPRHGRRAGRCRSIASLHAPRSRISGCGPSAVAPQRHVRNQGTTGRSANVGGLAAAGGSLREMDGNFFRQIAGRATGEGSQADSAPKWGRRMIRLILLWIALLVVAPAGASAAADCVPYSDGWNDFGPCTRVDSSGQRWVKPEHMRALSFDEHGVAAVWMEGVKSFYYVGRDGHMVPVVNYDNGPDAF